MSDDNPLLAAVEALVKPQKRGRWIERVADTQVPFYAIELVKAPTPMVADPLLEQLESAIGSSMGGSTSGASLKSQSSPLNARALMKALQIASELRRWSRVAAVEPRSPRRSLINELRAWHTATLKRALEPDQETSHVRQLRSWARDIEALLDPPRSRELPDPCPENGCTDWWDRDTRERMTRPVVVRYRVDDDEQPLIDTATASCRSCGHSWNARELAWELQEIERLAAAKIALDGPTQ
ncbi:hypothetical protein QT381_02640 [Galbitalea sp. SE-J8]|uniref:DUF7341 domain-containing protein n=1 Tax=Galbitalea sp. SE-J8 TaxID=3054952 RepID=UPI00259CC2AC|nr:hypothetical protein [Galbitalea sp. SE-J8]MDM4761901.1 hypothetical protein [Galbitalea sp. SE-J8]